ncbi:hypothetical protein D3C86_1441600 [compost metagenome]
MPVPVIEGLEVIGIDHQQRQRLATALRAKPFMAQGLIKGSTVGHAGQGIGGRQLRQFLLGTLAPSQLTAEQPGQPQQADAQDPCCTADHIGRAVPGGEHFVDGKGHDDGQRQIADPGKGVQAPLMIDTRHAFKGTTALAQHACDVGTAGQAFANGVLFPVRLLRQENPVVVDDAQRTAGADVEAVEQLIEVAHAHRRHRDPQEFTRGRGNAPTETDTPFVAVIAVAARLERSADKHAGVTIEGMGQEIIAVSEVARFRFDQ